MNLLLKLIFYISVIVNNNLTPMICYGRNIFFLFFYYDKLKLGLRSCDYANL